MSAIMESLRKDHENMRLLLDLLESQIEVFRRGEKPDYDLLRLTVEYCLGYPEHYHHPKEDEIYHRLRQKAGKEQDHGAQAPVDLPAAHGELSQMTRRVDKALKAILMEGRMDRRAVVVVIEHFISAYRQHISAEDDYFFPRAEKQLDDADWAALDAGMARIDDALFDGSTADDFRMLRQNILKWAG